MIVTICIYAGTKHLLSLITLACKVDISIYFQDILRVRVILSQELNYGRHLVNVCDAYYLDVYDWQERENCFLANTYFTYASDKSLCPI